MKQIFFFVLANEGGKKSGKIPEQIADLSSFKIK